MEKSDEARFSKKNLFGPAMPGPMKSLPLVIILIVSEQFFSKTVPNDFLDFLHEGSSL